MNLALSNENKRTRKKIHPKKFALYVACASMMMTFAGLTSAYIVRQAAGNWLEFRLPSMFFYSSAVMVLSSITLHFSYKGFVQKKTNQSRGLMILTFILGLLFLVLQYQGWLQMQAMGVEPTGNPSGSFVYVISWLHAAHLIGGLTALTIALFHAFTLKHRVTSKRKLRFELTAVFWHFVDFLWLYLLIFFVLQQ